MTRDYVLVRLDSPIGGRSPIWEYGHGAIGKFIARHGLKPVPRERLHIPKDFPGGWRIPHFHHDGEIFVLDNEQWTGFVRERLDEFGERLAKISTISFESFVDVGEAVLSTPVIPLPPPKPD